MRKEPNRAWQRMFFEAERGSSESGAQSIGQRENQQSHSGDDQDKSARQRGVDQGLHTDHGGGVADQAAAAIVDRQYHVEARPAGRILGQADQAGAPPRAKGDVTSESASAITPAGTPERDAENVPTQGTEGTAADGATGSDRSEAPEAPAGEEPSTEERDSQQ